MKKQSSNNLVDKQLEILKDIRKVEVPEGLYAKITERIQDRVRSVVPLYWVGAAAAGLAILVTLDVLAVRNRQDSTSDAALEQLISVTNNSLYHE